MQSIEAFLFIGGTARILLFFHRPFHRAVRIVEMATSSASQIREWRDFRVSHEGLPKVPMPEPQLACHEVPIRDSDDGRRWPVKRVSKNTTNEKVTPRTNRKVTRMNDPIRIVPLHLPSELYRPSAGIAAPPAAQLSYRGGPQLNAIKVFTVFWEQVWQKSPNSDLANQINQFFNFVVSSALIDQLVIPGGHNRGCTCG